MCPIWYCYSFLQYNMNKVNVKSDTSALNLWKRETMIIKVYFENVFHLQNTFSLSLYSECGKLGTLDILFWAAL